MGKMNILVEMFLVCLKKCIYMQIDKCLKQQQQQQNVLTTEMVENGIGLTFIAKLAFHMVVLAESICVYHHAQRYIQRNLFLPTSKQPCYTLLFTTYGQESIKLVGTLNQAPRKGDKIVWLSKSRFLQNCVGMKIGLQLEGMRHRCGKGILCLLPIV